MTDLKITELGANTELVGTDLLVCVDDPGGTPATQYITVSNFLKALALQAGLLGTSNTALGSQALDSVEAGGNYNVGVGANVLDALTTGDNNVAVGYAAGGAVTTGGNNILLGYQAGDGITDGTDNIIIGHDIEPPSGASATHELNIGGLIKGHVAATQLLGFYGENGVAQAAHITDPTDLGTCVTAITSILTALENLGLVASS